MCTVIESEPVIGCGIWYVCIAIDNDTYARPCCCRVPVQVPEQRNEYMPPLK